MRYSLKMSQKDKRGSEENKKKQSEQVSEEQKTAHAANKNKNVTSECSVQQNNELTQPTQASKEATRVTKRQSNAPSLSELVMEHPKSLHHGRYHSSPLETSSIKGICTNEDGIAIKGLELQERVTEG